MNLFTYLKEVSAELKEVSWPTRAQTINYTVLVIIISVVTALFLGGVDFGIKTILAKLLA